jgi:hypothetical protein
MALTIASATSLILISSSSPTGRGINIQARSVCVCSRHTTENYWLYLIVLSQLPDEELGKVLGVDELTQWLSGSRNDERGAVLCRPRKYMGGQSSG